MMAVGKTTLGKIVAKRLEMEFIDTDLNIEEKNSMTINEIFKKKGELFFRMEEEKEVLKSLKNKNCVISLGGGAFINKNLRKNILENSISIWLDVDIKTLNKRIKWNNKRPLTNSQNFQKKIKELYTYRKNIYKLAKHKISCDRLDKENIVKKIVSIYEKH